MASHQQQPPTTTTTTNDDLITQEVAHVLTVLSLQSNPLKEDTLKQVGAASPLVASSLPSSNLSIEIQHLEWMPESRTLRLSAYPDVGLYAASSSSSTTSTSTSATPLTRQQQLLLAPPLHLELFFPESPSDPPFCFGATDAAALVAERVNASILPLERSSLLHAVSKIVAIIKQEVDSIWPPSSPSPSPSSSSSTTSTTDSNNNNTTTDYRTQFGHALATYLTENVTSADLFLSLLSMSKPHHPTVKFPVPRFFYQREGSLLINHQALLWAIGCIPPLEKLVGGGTEGKDNKAAVAAIARLPFSSCVLLHHLFFRARVTLVDEKLRHAVASPRGGGAGAQGGGGGGGEAEKEGEGEGEGTDNGNNDDEEIEKLLARAGLDSKHSKTHTHTHTHTTNDDDRPARIFLLQHAADARFTTLAQKHGTKLGFHGSAPANFFSIVSLGLKNLSGTKGEKNGSIFGEGVYLASKCAVARNFGGWGTSVWRHSRFAVSKGNGGGGAGGGGVDDVSSTTLAAPQFAYQIIALCEFIALPQYQCGLTKTSSGSTSSSNSRGGNSTSSASSSSGAPTGTRTAASSSKSNESEYYVISEDEHLVVRALLLYKDPQRQQATAQPQQQSQHAAAGARDATSANLGGGIIHNNHGKYLHFGIWILKALFFLTALVLLLDGIDKFTSKRGFAMGGGNGRGGRGGKGPPRKLG